MKDHIRQNVYVEMVRMNEQDYVANRADEVLALQGVRRLSWWENLMPDRSDWVGDMRAIDDFTLLAVYEVDDVFDAPDAPSGIGNIHFRRYPRPSQGTLTGSTRGLSVVLITPRTSSDQASAQALRDWGDFVHFPPIFSAGIPGYRLVTPYENVSNGDPRFMHFYELSDDDAETVFQRTLPYVQKHLGGGEGNAAFDAWVAHPELNIMYVNNFRLLGAREG